MTPFVLGLLVCLALNALALAAALALAVRAKPSGRAELGVAVTMLWNLLVMCPVYALGLTNHLSARPLAISSALWFAFVFLVARGRTSAREFGREVRRAAWGLLRMPFDALAAAFRARSLVFLVVPFVMAMLSWTFYCAWLSPSWRQWDALWYHEPIVGFSIQNHGFSVVDLPQGGAQKINGYPRLCEMTQLWFVIFTDRRVIDMVGHLVMPSLALGVYVLARRYTNQVVAMGLGCALIAMPLTSVLIGSAYVDVHNAAFVVAGAHFATRPVLRMRDAALAAACLALAVGSKHMAIVPVLILSLVAAVRVLRHLRARPLPAIGTVLGGTALIVGTAATTYARNWINFGNPFWPDFKFDSDRLGIHWPGGAPWGAGDYTAGVNRIDMNLPFDTLLEDLYRIPYTVHRSYYGQSYEYGIGTPWVIVPIVFFAVFALATTPILDLFARIFRRPELRVAPETRNVSLLAATLLPMLYFSPALWGARYQIAAVGIALGIVAWVCGRRGFERFGDGVASTLSVLAIMSFFWAQPRWWLWWSDARTLAAIPYPEREFTPASAISPDLGLGCGSSITKEAGLARERQVGPGAVLAFDGNYGQYMALFWNNDYSNKVVWVPEGPDFLGRVASTNATWLYAAYNDSLYNDLKGKDSGWVEVAPLNVEHWGAVFRRTRW